MLNAKKKLEGRQSASFEAHLRASKKANGEIWRA